MNEKVFDFGNEWRTLIISSAISEAYAQLFSEHKSSNLISKLRDIGLIIDDKPQVHSELMKEINSKWDDLSEDDRNCIIKYSCEVNKIMKIYRIKVFTKEDNIKEVTEALARKVRYYAKVITLQDYGRIIGDQFIIDIHKWNTNLRANRGHVIVYDNTFSDEEVEVFIDCMGTGFDGKQTLFIKLDKFQDIVDKYEEYENMFINYWIKGGK